MTAPIRAFTLVLALIAAAPAAAQDEASFVKSFSGDWFIFDPQFATGETCAVGLAPQKRSSDGRYEASATNCVKPLADVTGWDIDSGQLRLFTEGAETPMAQLGGNQMRITGTLAASGRGLIVERASGDESTRNLAQALGRHRCIYRGFTDSCADTADLGKPDLTEEGGAYGSVGVLVDLNVRDQPRSNAPIVGTLPAGTCLKVNYCSTASDGVWCRARFGEREGWIRKVALRQNEWPALTFANSCPSDE